ncbi:MAG: hypothetical protein ACLTMP_07710 [Eggerthella lenta]
MNRVGRNLDTRMASRHQNGSPFSAHAQRADDGAHGALKERPLKSITVTELAELADVNRATFYALPGRTTC